MSLALRKHPGLSDYTPFSVVAGPDRPLCRIATAEHSHRSHL